MTWTVAGISGARDVAAYAKQALPIVPPPPEYSRVEGCRLRLTDPYNCGLHPSMHPGVIKGNASLTDRADELAGHVRDQNRGQAEPRPVVELPEPAERNGDTVDRHK